MPDELKELFEKFLRRELAELRQNKIRTIALAVSFVAVTILYFVFNDDAEEIDLSDPPPVTKDLPVQKLHDKKISAQVPESPDGVKIVLGATTDELFIDDPFQGKEKPLPPKKVDLPPIPPPSPIQQPIQPSPQPIQQPPSKVEPKEKIFLTGTAVSVDNKTAMFLRGEKNFFRSVGEEVDGRIISDITPDFVTFTDGTRVFITKELK